VNNDWKRCGWKQSWYNFKLLPQLLPEGSEENHKKSSASQGSQCLGQNSNHGSSEYKSEVLPLQITLNLLMFITVKVTANSEFNVDLEHM
jgi:hypothetical protein